MSNVKSQTNQSSRLNSRALDLFYGVSESPESIRCRTHSVGGGRVLDAGVETSGSLAAGFLLAELCLGDSADIALAPANPAELVVDNGVMVTTDDPVRACLGAQYAGWPVQTESFFAMGSGPMRMFRGREEVLKELSLSESGDCVVGVLESDKLPTADVIELIAAECGVATDGVHLAVAPSTSIAGSIQVVARSIETALHKLHELKFDVTSVVSASGFAPLPPPAKPGDTVQGIGRTNDAMLYGARVTLWVDCDDAAIEVVAGSVPSSSSKDHGAPFAEIFKQYKYDFYQVDPLLFSPAVVTISNLRSGRTWSAGKIETEILKRSFLS